MSDAVAYVARQEKDYNATVIDCEDVGVSCRSCGSTAVVYTLHCWREEARPVVALCKPCASVRAGGVERVAVRSDRLGLAAGWKQGKRAIMSEKQQARQLRAASARRKAPCDSPNDALGSSGAR